MKPDKDLTRPFRDFIRPWQCPNVRSKISTRTVKGFVTPIFKWKNCIQGIYQQSRELCVFRSLHAICIHKPVGRVSVLHGMRGREPSKMIASVIVVSLSLAATEPRHYQLIGESLIARWLCAATWGGRADSRFRGVLTQLRRGRDISRGYNWKSRVLCNVLGSSRLASFSDSA